MNVTKQELWEAHDKLCAAMAEYEVIKETFTDQIMRDIPMEVLNYIRLDFTRLHGPTRRIVQDMKETIRESRNPTIKKIVRQAD